MTTAPDPYAAIAAWYDLEHDALTDDVECLHELIGASAPGRARVLEVGAGTGRIAAGLAVAGMEVTAVEPSPAMRERAAKRLAAMPERVARRVQLVAGSATDLGIDASEQFDAVNFGLGTFGHLATLTERLGALAAARAHLRPGGLLVIDLDLAGLRRLAETPGQLYHQGTWLLPPSAPPPPSAPGAPTRYVSHFVAAGTVREGGLITLTHFYDLHEQGGNGTSPQPVARTVSQMPLALLSRGEVELALRHSGYEVEAVYGGYNQEPYEEGAGRALFVAISPRTA